MELEWGVCCGILTEQVKLSDCEGTVEEIQYGSRSSVKIPFLIHQKSPQCLMEKYLGNLVFYTRKAPLEAGFYLSFTSTDKASKIIQHKLAYDRL